MYRYFLKAFAGKGTTVPFPIVPTTIGTMMVKATAVAGAAAADAVQRDLLVEVREFVLGCQCTVAGLVPSLIIRFRYYEFYDLLAFGMSLNS